MTKRQQVFAHEPTAGFLIGNNMANLAFFAGIRQIPQKQIGEESRIKQRRILLCDLSKHDDERVDAARLNAKLNTSPDFAGFRSHILNQHAVATL